MAKKEASDQQKELEQAFSVFNEFADKLSSSYSTLESRISQLNEELSEAHDERLLQLAEKEMLASRLSHLLEALPAGIVVLDARGRVTEANPTAEDLLDVPLVGEEWWAVIKRAFKTDGQSGGSEVELNDGRLVSISTCPLGKEPGQIIMLLDVTETRRLQGAVERYKRLSAMGEMTAKLAHQIRTPLSSAMLYTSQLAKGALAPADQQRFAGKALSQLKHLEKMVEDMLAFTRGGGAGHERFSLSEFIEELRQVVEPALEAEGCRLYVREQVEEGDLYANKDALLSAIRNLIDNAVNATGEGGILWLTSRPVEAHHGMPSVDIVLKDNGPGIPPDLRSRIFEPFFTTRSKGTGLGLAVAQAVVQNHGGGLWIDSTSNEGTTFVIRLPLARQEGGQAALMPEQNKRNAI